jgi:hypothetical protein
MTTASTRKESFAPARKAFSGIDRTASIDITGRGGEMRVTQMEN